MTSTSLVGRDCVATGPDWAYQSPEYIGEWFKVHRVCTGDFAHLIEVRRSTGEVLTFPRCCLNISDRDAQEVQVVS